MQCKFVMQTALISVENCLQVAIKNSNFYSNAVQLLKVQQSNPRKNAQVVIQNTTFSSMKYRLTYIPVSHLLLVHKGANVHCVFDNRIKWRSSVPLTVDHEVSKLILQKRMYLMKIST